MFLRSLKSEKDLDHQHNVGDLDDYYQHPKKIAEGCLTK